jgi:putative ABC transport system permease protein
MRWLHRLFKKHQAENQLDAELRFHLERQISDYVASGLAPEEARRRANLEFGGLESIKQQAREARRGNFLETLFQDLRYAARMLRKSPGFTIAAVITLALGIGANTAIFSIVNAVILRPLPYKDSSRIVSVHLKTSLFPTFNLGLSWPAFEQIRLHASALEYSGVYTGLDKTLTGKNEPAILGIQSVSDGFFEELGTTAELGRLFTAQDYASGQNNVLVLSDTLWRTRFGASPSILGQSLTLDKMPYTVVGVAARICVSSRMRSVAANFLESRRQAEPDVFQSSVHWQTSSRPTTRTIAAAARHHRPTSRSGKQTASCVSRDESRTGRRFPSSR